MRGLEQGLPSMDAQPLQPPFHFPAGMRWTTLMKKAKSEYFWEQGRPPHPHLAWR